MIQGGDGLEKLEIDHDSLINNNHWCVPLIRSDALLSFIYYIPAFIHHHLYRYFHKVSQKDISRI